MQAKELRHGRRPRRDCEGDVKDRFCPLFFNNKNNQVDPLCYEDSCAWWNADQQKCAIAVIAEKILEEEKG